MDEKIINKLQNLQLINADNNEGETQDWSNRIKAQLYAQIGGGGAGRNENHENNNLNIIVD